MNVVFHPYLPWPLLAGLGGVLGLVLAFAAARRGPGVQWRLLLFAIGGLALTNPTLVSEQRHFLPDIAVVVVDQSPSMKIGARAKTAAAAEAAIRRQMGNRRNIELRFVRVAGSDAGTPLFAPLMRTLAGIPRDRLAGIVTITDGEVDDVPPAKTLAGLGAPLQVLLAGREGEIDRRLVVDRAPSYGIVGRAQTIRLHVAQAGAAGTEVPLTVTVGDHPPRRMMVPIGAPVTVPFTLDHGGKTAITLSVPPGPDSLTLRNKSAVLVVNGVLDRLRVLLISGRPYAGERLWRNLLKSDPAVDLIHFTILRPPDKQDATPVRELSLIAFPVERLFTEKLPHFNLVIFDRYRQQGLIAPEYLQKVAQYVARGGALLVSVGPSFATPYSLYQTPLAAVLPARPTGKVFLGRFTPKLTAAGERQPITAMLPGAAAKAAPTSRPAWGPWFSQVDTETTGGTVLMTGHDGAPLLVVNRVGKGRVGEFLSDQIWLWARGYDGGGPTAELLRRLVYWLMKEPALEENRLSARVANDQIEIARQTMAPDAAPVTVTRPDGKTETVHLKPSGSGRAVAQVPVAGEGVYRLSDGTLSALAVVGSAELGEYSDVRATAARLAPAATASHGSIHWLNAGMPEIRRVAAGGPSAGTNWIGLVRRRAYAIAGFREKPLLPPALALVLMLAAILLAWRREGR